MIVLFVIADSLRADELGFCGGSARTPLLDQLAREGAWSEHVFASGAWTVPSLMAMLTGQYPHRIGVARWRHPYPARRPNLLTAFRAAGFEVSCFYPHPRWGLLAVPGAGSVGDSQDPDAVTRALGAPRGADRFILVHHWWTHLPYLSHKLETPAWHTACDFALESLGLDPERIAPAMRAAYRGSVELFSETYLARYLTAALSHGQQVLLVLTSDHGENWGEALPPGERVKNVYDLHGRWLADSTIRVPLLVWGHAARGRIDGGRAIEGMIPGIALGPTLADLAGIPWPGPLPDEAGRVAERSNRAGPEDLEIAGSSIASSIFDHTPTRIEATLTVTSHNTHVPHSYPGDGRLLWRTFGRRTRRGWYVWDGVEQHGEFSPLPGAATDGEAEAPTQFALLEQERLGAVDPGPSIEDGSWERLRGRSVEQNNSLEQRLASLGYLD